MQTIELGINGIDPSAVVLGQFDNNASLDIAIANAGSDNVMIFHNGGAGAFAPTATQTIPVGAQPMGLAAGHFAGNDGPDLVVANSGSNTIHVLPNVAHVFQPAGPSQIVPVGDEPEDVDPWDPDQDKDTYRRIVVTNHGISATPNNPGTPGSVMIIPNANGTLQPPSPETTFTTGFGSVRLMSANFDQSTNLDAGELDVQDDLVVVN